MKSIGQIIANLPPQRRAKIEARTREVVGEELALQQLRKARRLTQKQMARFLGVGQDSISRLESRSDLLISTLQSYVEAMGGALKIVVEFKEGTTVLSGLGSDEPAKRSLKGAHDRKSSPRRKRANSSRTRAS
jgi:transcriptional regulator with XRE-family HTH domain